jgi:REP element-mobilizing transposase RayT
MIRFYHVNFHTFHNEPVFLAKDVDSAIRAIMRDVLREHQILCLAFEVMPTHVHLILADFPDKSRSESMRLLKGATAYHFLRDQPAFRNDLGDHLWQEGYDWQEITTHRQFVATLRYVRENRARGGIA